MIINLHKIKIRDLFEGYVNDGDKGVFAYKGNLNIRPKYQREFTYEIDKQISVIDTVINGFPLNVMYWVKNNDDVSFELLDGQQRTLSICSFLSGDFSIEYNGNPHFFKNIKMNYPQLAESILDYELMCYFCEKDANTKNWDDEKLKWFRTINIAGKTLNDQELLNASFVGKWLSSAKSQFSKPDNCPAQKEGSDYIKGRPIEQDYLHIALKWISHRDKTNIAQYMSSHQGDSNCNDLWTYFMEVIVWARQTFKIHRKELKGLELGILYNDFKSNNYDADVLEDEFQKINRDPNINSSVADIYRYLITGNENLLNRRAFDDKIKRKIFEKQKIDKTTNLSMCLDCGNLFKYEDMEGDHIEPWSKGGKSTIDNCQMLCKSCNGKKSNN